MRRSRAKGISSEERRKLSRYYEAHLATSLLYTHTAKKVFFHLSALQIPAVPLKGIWLLFAHYPDGDRVLHDLDIFIPPPHFDRAVAALAELGFQTIFDNQGSHLILEKRGAPRVELHYELINQAILPEPMLFPAGKELFSRRLFAGTLHSIPCTLLSPEDHLLFLFFHLFREEFLLYKWWGDCLLLYPRLSLSRLQRAAQELQVEKLLSFSLSLLPAFFGSASAKLRLQRATRASRTPLLRLALYLSLSAKPPPSLSSLVHYLWRRRELHEAQRSLQSS